MNILLYLLLFQSSWYSLLLFVLPIEISYSVFVAAIAFLCICALFLRVVRYDRGKIAKNVMIVIFASILVAGGFCLTELGYGFTEAKFRSYELSYISEVIPAIMIAAYIAKSKSLQVKVKKDVPIVGIILSLFALYTAVFPDGFDNIGLIETSYGLNYQTNSYMAAYAFSLMLYYILLFDKVSWPRHLNSKVARNLGTIIALADIFTVIKSGGRGGVVFIFATIVFFALVMRMELLKKRTFLTLWFSVIGAILVAPVLMSWLQEKSQSVTAVRRLMKFLSGTSDPIRMATVTLGIKAFTDKPVFGHGVGAVFYELGMYSHNIVLDWLIELGLFGSILVVLLFYSCIRQGLAMCRVDPVESIWFVFFLTGFIMSLFSGYYLSLPSIFVGLTFWWCVNTRPFWRKQEKIEGSI